MIGIILDLLFGKKHPVRVHDPIELKEGDKIVLDSGQEEYIKVDVDFNPVAVETVGKSMIKDQRIIDELTQDDYDDTWKTKKALGLNTCKECGAQVSYWELDEKWEDNICPDCSKKSKQKESLKESIEKVFDELNELTDEEFDAELRKHMSFEEGECHPAECEGECDGMGWCDIATEYRTKTDHRNNRK